MTKKQRTIEAFLKTVEKYENPQGKYFFRETRCDVCRIHIGVTFFDGISTIPGICRGCPLSSELGNHGCIQFKTYIDASKAYKSKCDKLKKSDTDIYIDAICGIYTKSWHTLQSFKKRAEAYRLMIPLIEKIPAERFTKKGWKYFSELDRSL